MTHCLSLSACDMAKGNQIQMPTDIHKPMVAGTHDTQPTPLHWTICPTDNGLRCIPSVHLRGLVCPFAFLLLLLNTVYSENNSKLEVYSNLKCHWSGSGTFIKGDLGWMHSNLVTIIAVQFQEERLPNWVMTIDFFLIHLHWRNNIGSRLSTPTREQNKEWGVLSRHTLAGFIPRENRQITRSFDSGLWVLDIVILEIGPFHLYCHIGY